MFKKFLSKKNKYYGFTLVELIIVITILAILATIAFISFSGYTGNSRDSNRLFSIKEISKSLTIQKELTGNYPVPDSIYATGGITVINPNLFNVGIIGKGVSNYIKLGSIPLDPKSKNEYSYGLTKDNKYFQVAGTLENGEVLGYKLVSQTYAAGLPTAVVEGNYKGLIKFSTGGTNYIGNIPSLIYSRDGTYSGSDKKFVINKGTNVPYLVGGNVGEGLDESKIVKEYYGTGTSIKTEIIDTSTITKEDVKKISNKLGVSELEIAQVVDKKELIDYYASIPSSGGSSSGGNNEGNGSSPGGSQPVETIIQPIINEYGDVTNKTTSYLNAVTTDLDFECRSSTNQILNISTTCYDLGGEMVYDKRTGLYWESTLNNNLKVTFNQAKSNCANLVKGGFSDWRLPNIIELQSIYNYSNVNQPYNNKYFNNYLTSRFWSSTSTTWKSYYLAGSSGLISDEMKDNGSSGISVYSLCVR